MKRVFCSLVAACGLVACGDGGSSEGSPSNDASIWVVVRVVDGDTIQVKNSVGAVKKVRFIGIDTPEEGECGFVESKVALEEDLANKEVQLTPGATSDRDKYDRLLRYVDLDGDDIGLRLIEDGLAIARYDSRDGYGSHPREKRYIAADEASENLCLTTG